MSKLVPISGMTLVELRIPRTALRPPFHINTDVAHVDVRRFKRHLRRAGLKFRADDWRTHIDGRTPWH